MSSFPKPHSVRGQKPATRQPVLWAALAYAGGVFVGSSAWRPPLWWLMAGLVFGTSAIYFLHRRARLGMALALSSLFVFGALTIQVRGSAKDELGDSSLSEGQDVMVTAHVIREGSLESKSTVDLRQKLDLQTEQVDLDGRILESRSGVRVTFYRKADSPDGVHEFRYGERVRFPTKLYRPAQFSQPWRV